jgi:A/G-specific adenine glycosylase
VDKDVHEKVFQAALTLAAEGSVITVGQNFPWRTDPTPYRIFLAEFLLVRTRTDVVIRVFDELVSQFPDAQSLSRANEDDLALLLKPLGLPQRVPILLRAARYIIEDAKGNIPTTIDSLKEVPGMGNYTAVAVAAFAFGSTEVPADVNILRFIARFTGLPMEHPTKGSRELRKFLPLLSVSKGGPQLMVLLDFTRIICRPRKPQCNECPLSETCYSFRNIFLQQTLS